MKRLLISLLTLTLLFSVSVSAERIEGIGEIVAHNAMLPAPVGTDSVAFLRLDEKIPGKPIELFVMNLETGKETRVLPGFDFKEMPSYTFAFEPNGQSFVVPRIVSGQWEILRYRPGQRQGDVLTNLREFREGFPPDLALKLKTKDENLVMVSDMAFSPSGKRVIFNLALPDHFALWLLNVETQEIRQVAPENVGYYAQVHPEEDKIYFTANAVRAAANFDQDILLRNIATGDVDTLVSDGYHEFAAVISPDTNYIVYSQRKHDITDVWVKNLVTGEKRMITSTPEGAHCNYPRWSADGKWIYYQVAGLEDIPMTGRTRFTEF